MACKSRQVICFAVTYQISYNDIPHDHDVPYKRNGYDMNNEYQWDGKLRR